jgi:hypothetical protein
MPKRLLVGLHIAAAAPDAIFELAPGRVECVAQRHLKVSVLGVRARLARDGDLLAGQGQVDVHFVKVAVFVVFAGRLHDHPATHDIVGEPVQPVRLVPYQCLDRWRRIHVAERNLQGKLHGSTSFR